MTGTRNQLIQAALQIASAFKDRQREAEKRQASLRLEVQQQEAVANEAGLSFERGLNFGKALGGEMLCPRCWIANGNRTELVPIPSQSGEVDEFRCRACHDEYSFPA